MKHTTITASLVLAVLAGGCKTYMDFSIGTSGTTGTGGASGTGGAGGAAGAGGDGGIGGCDPQSSCQPGVLLWSERFGDASDQYGQGVATDSKNNVLLVGWYSGTIDFGGGPLAGSKAIDVCLAKFDPAGNHLWSKTFGQTGETLAYKVVVGGDDSVAIAGDMTGQADFGGGPLVSAGSDDIFVAKFTGNGAPLWSKRFGDASGQHATAIATDSSGSLLVTGYFTGSIDFGGGTLTSAGNDDVFVTKLDADGKAFWSKRFGDAGKQYGRSIATGTDGTVYVTGYYSGSIDFGDGALPNAGGHDIFVAKLDVFGNTLWSKRFGDGDDQNALGLAVDGQGSVLVAGNFRGAVDFGGGPLLSPIGQDAFLAKLDADGNHLWSKRFGDADGQSVSGLSVDGGGNVVVTGYLSGNASFGGPVLMGAGAKDLVIAKFDPGGGHLWSKRYGDPAIQVGASVATDTTGAVLVTGYLSGTVNFGQGPLVGAGGVDVFLAKFSP
jgi:hypothetical protein